MNQELVELSRAFHFAALRHEQHRRKGERAEPYVNHLAEVLLLLAEATGGEDPVLLLGALLHDTVEDTETTLAELEETFGPEVARLVSEVTDDKALPKEERKRLQIETIRSKSERARLLKMADQTSNVRSLGSSPPAHWTLQRKQQYIHWAQAVVDGCRGLNAHLEEAFDQASQAAAEVLGSDG